MIELARQTQDSYQSLCDRFRAATGWSLRFIRLQSQTADEIETELVERGEYSLWQRVDDGRKCIGLLVVDLPDVATPFGSEPTSGSYDSVLGLTESIASLMSRQAQAERALLEKRKTSTTVSHVGCSLRPGMGLGENVRELLAAAVRLSGYQSASFYTLNPSTDRLKLRFVHGIQAHNLPMGQRELASSWLDLEALSRGYSFIERKSQSDDQWLPRDAKSGLAFGVQSDLIPLGTLWIYDSRPRSFPDHELKLLQDVANQLALALERAVLLDENESQHRVQTELRLVSEQLNQASRPALPSSCGMDATYRCESRHEISGDLCELLSLSGTTTAIAVGDASGNSIPAALVANAVKGALRSMSCPSEDQRSPPARVMQRLNKALDSIVGDYQFMSLFYGVYDATLRRLSYCSAGHPAPILLRDGHASMLHADGFLLGILDEVEYECVELELQPQDLLIVYTDGVSETHGPTDRLFGEGGIVKAIQSARLNSIEEIRDAIWDQAEAFGSHSGKTKADDRSLMVIRIL
jgi:sigma-B regulation protein RsbU (phosphoserine phosphatase)